jgi:hypothetical protein
MRSYYACPFCHLVLGQVKTIHFGTSRIIKQLKQYVHLFFCFTIIIHAFQLFLGYYGDWPPLAPSAGLFPAEEKPEDKKMSLFYRDGGKNDHPLTGINLSRTVVWKVGLLQRTRYYEVRFVFTTNIHRKMSMHILDMLLYTYSCQRKPCVALEVKLPLKGLIQTRDPKWNTTELKGWTEALGWTEHRQQTI